MVDSIGTSIRSPFYSGKLPMGIHFFGISNGDLMGMVVTSANSGMFPKEFLAKRYLFKDTGGTKTHTRIYVYISMYIYIYI